MDFLEKLKPKIISRGRIRAIELDADIFLRIEMSDIQVLVTEGEEGIIHLVAQNGPVSVVLRLTENF